MKTFWGWRDQQLPDGTLILTSAAGRTHVTTPGSHNHTARAARRAEYTSYADLPHPTDSDPPF